MQWNGCAKWSKEGLAELLKDTFVRLLKSPFRSRDRLIVIFVCMVSAVAGSAYLFGWMGPAVNPYFTEDYYPALYVGCGQGLVMAPANLRGAEVEAFLRYERPLLQPQELPSSPSAQGCGGFALCHRYLMYTLGTVWRIFGVSWNAFRGLLVVFLCITVVLAYGLFRLVARPPLSLALTLLFLFSGGVLTMVSRFRDFSKAPFIFGVLLVLGWIMTRRLSTRRFLALSALLGLIPGIGLGFRQDLQICLPVCAVVLLFCERGAWRRSMPERLAALAIMMVAFLVPSSPIRHSMAGMPASSHHLTMGLATTHEDNLGLCRTTYERSYLLHDMFAYAESNSFASRVEGFKEPIAYQSAESGWAEKQFFLENAKTFPGDFLTRAYAAALWAVNGASPVLPRFCWPQYNAENPLLARIERVRAPLTAHLIHYGGFYALAALLIVSVRSVRSALLLLGIVLYFSGYTSLQFQYRHCFHLMIIPLWFVGFVLQQVWDNAHPVVQALRRKGPAIEWGVPLKRALLFALVSAAALYLPLRVARACQVHEVSSLLEGYKHAELEPISTEAQVLTPEWTLIRPMDRAPSPLGSATQRDVPFRTEYLAVELKSSPQRRVLILRYDSDNSDSSFGLGVVVEPTGSSDAGSAYYFFPVYESPNEASMSGYTRFAGIALPNEYAGEFKKLHRVTNLNDFRLLPNFTVPADPAFLRPYETFLPFNAALDADYATKVYFPNNPDYQVANVRGKLAAGDGQEAANVARGVLSLSPQDVSMNMGLGDALVLQGRADEAVSAFKNVVAASPDFVPVYGRLDAVFAKRGGAEQKASAWQELTGAFPKAGLAYVKLAEALDAAGNLDPSKAAFLKAAELCPTDPEVYVRLASCQVRAGDTAGGIASYWTAMGLAPDDMALRRRFAEMFEAAGDLNTARQVCLDALVYSVSDPQSHTLAAIFNGIGEKMKALPEQIAAWQYIVRVHPAAAMAHNQLGGMLLRTGNAIGAEKAFRDALRLAPGDAMFAASLGGLLEQKGDSAAAVSVYREALAVAPGNATLYGLLGTTLTRLGNTAEALRLYRKAVRQYPGEIELWLGLARMEAGQGDTDAALNTLRKALSIAPGYFAVVCGDIEEVLGRANDEGRRTAFWRDVCSEYPKMDSSWMYLGDSQLRANDVDGAIESFSRACALAPNSEAAKAKLDSAQKAKGKGAAS